MVFKSLMPAVIASMTYLAACGSGDPATFELQQASEDFSSGEIFAAYAATASDSNSVTLYASYKAQEADVYFCNPATESCDTVPAGVRATFQRMSNDRAVFRADREITVSVNLVLHVLVYDRAAGQTYIRKIRFELPGSGGGTRWKALFMTGDDSINAFDNARKKLKNMFVGFGVQPSDVRELSRRSSEQTSGVMATNSANLEAQLKSLAISEGDGCLIHMTSHGSREGFYLRDQPTLSPSKFASMLDAACGDKPTVVLVSACFSGVFITNQAMLKPNRIILTAARHDRTSFGCGPENQYTYWDNCLIDHLASGKTWKTFQDEVVQCINRKEGGGNFSSSLPQGYFGANTEAYKIP